MLGHIAIVDDDESVRRAMTRLVQAYSFRVHSYSSGREFLDSLNRGVPACLILDMQMEGMTGLELLHHLASMGLRVPTIIVTAHDEPGMRDSCKRAGAVAFLPKPASIEALLKAIKSATATSSPGRQSGRRLAILARPGGNSSINDPTEVMLRRDRYVVLGAMLALTTTTFGYVAWSNARPAIPSGSMEMAAVPLLFTFGMWITMMIGMMTPAVAPMLLLHTRVRRLAELQRDPFVPTAWFATGYFLAWAAFSISAAILQIALTRAALLTSMVTIANGALAGALLIMTGLFQWSRFKYLCLTECQVLPRLIQLGMFKRDVIGTVRLGFQYGMFCVGCCWAFMLLLFVGGVMNILWVACLSLLVLTEKLVPLHRTLPRATGVFLFMGGTFLILRGLSV